MAGNVCPKCGKAVMTYARFFREAEPYRVSPCGSCGVQLRRSRMVYLLLVVMVALLYIPGAGLVAAMHHGLPLWAIALLGVLLVVGWIFLVNYLGYRIVGWVLADKEP